MSGGSPGGTTPAGARTEREAAQWVRDMFGRVAHRYDLANHLLSGNLDRWWRAHTVRRLGHVLERGDARVLDICCGTGDLALELEKRAAPGVRILASDFCQPMLVAAHAKISRRRARVELFAADTLALPLAGGSLDLVAVAFGFRNLANYRAGLAEMRRVLRPGGTAAILEFSQPPNRAFRATYQFYARRILPAIGGALSGDRGAYAYLPESVRKFPDAAALAGLMRAEGFAGVAHEFLTGGIVALHLGTAE
jgi:demethylmenaquinone methyltransferase / 2-methoxy-6-polyprenyl-1,4-benzoquinol methylase